MTNSNEKSMRDSIDNANKVFCPVKIVVTYTIHNDEKREKFAKDLNSVDLKKFDDQSTHHGTFKKRNDNDCIEKYLSEISKNLAKDDVVYLFEGDLMPNKKTTINCIPIQINSNI